MQKETEFRQERLSQSFKPGAESVFILRLCGHSSVNGGKLISASETGGYVLVIPQVGEFNVELGEIIDGERIPLHYDSFCMK